jgi:crossover junction endodeoxyribonuclease RusA
MRPIIAKHREWANVAALGAGYYVDPDGGDIQIHVTFYPPDNRGDRINFPNRMKAYFDGIADALGVNDKRFVPHFYFCKPEKPGRVEVRIGT